MALCHRARASAAAGRAPREERRGRLTVRHLREGRGGRHHSPCGIEDLVAGIVAGLGGMAVRGTAAKEKAAQGSDSCPPETPRLCPTTCGFTCAGCCEDNDCSDGEACHNGSCGTCDATG